MKKWLLVAMIAILAVGASCVPIPVIIPTPVEDPQGPVFVLTAPRAYQEVAPGETLVIKWDSPLRIGKPGKVRISLHKGEREVIWRAFAESGIGYFLDTPDTGQYNWQIPSNAPEGYDYSVRISGAPEYPKNYTDSQQFVIRKR